MFVKGLSTRHTAVGTFRFGVVYEVNEKDAAIKKHVLPLLDGKSPALEEISKAKAEKEMATPTQFTPEATAPDAKATAADLRDAVTKAQKAQKEAEGKLSTLEDEMLKAVEERDVALASLKDQEDLMATAQKEIADLQTKLADLEEANK